MKIVDSTFSYNSADATGGGLWVRAYSSSLYGSGAIIRGSEFFNNTANIGAGFYSGSVLFLEDSTLDSNIATNRGGGFATSLGGTVNTNVQHSSFINNQAGECGGGFSSRGVKLVNSILVQNTAPYGGAFCAQYAVLILNSLVIDNSSGIDVYSDYDFNIIVNSIFEGNNNQDFTRATASSANQIVTFKNNFINLDNVESLYFEDNNIFKDIVLGFVDSANGNYQLTQGSHLIDSGSQDCVKEPPEYGSTLYCNIGPITGPIGQTDLNGSARLFGAYIDIGPYEYADSDGDGIGNYQDTDDDNDGVIDAADAYPLIAIGDLADVDKDGVPDACDEACLALGMTADTDNDNDGVEDSLDAFPLNAEEQVDTDGDGVGDNYEILNGLNINDKDSDADGLRDDKEVALGTNPLSSDSDLDGVIDGKDKFPLVSLGELEDSDGDGAPDECDDTCLASGMTADRDGIPPYILLDQPTPEFANLVSTAKIIVTSSDGENFFDVARYVDEVSVVGQTFLISGSSDIDGFMVMPGVKYDLTNLKGSVDKLYMSGPLEEYADSILLDEDTGMMQLSRLTDIGHEVVQFIATNVASDLVIFTDGAISTALIKEAILDGSSLLELTLDTTLSTLDAKAATGAQVKHIVLDSDGAGVMGLGPKITQLISGSSGVDKIYVPAGSVVDASNLKASQDEVYLEGDLDDYTLNYNSSGNIVLSRDVLIDDETFTESVTVANGGNVATNDLIIFADQQVTSEALKLQIN